jgi:4-hydroxy-2-oxoheptanedioate aldolase
MAFPMIETPKGVKNINAILDTPGVGGVLVGPTDLTMNHGEGRWNNPADKKPDTEAAIQTVAKACVAKKRACAMVTSNDAETRKFSKTASGSFTPLPRFEPVVVVGVA